MPYCGKAQQNSVSGSKGAGLEAQTVGLGPLHQHKGNAGLKGFLDKFSKFFLPQAYADRQATLSMSLNSFCSVKLASPTRCNPSLPPPQTVVYLVSVGVLHFL